MKTKYSSTAINHAGSPAFTGTTRNDQRGSALGSDIKLLCLAAAIFAASALPSLASDLVGIYALVDKVVLEPNESAPERIQVWGGFALAEGRGYEYAPAQRGYMYFKLKPDKQSLCRNEWSDLKSVAGTGKIVAFGMRHSDNGTVRKADTKIEKPDVYPIGMGVHKVSKKDYKPLNELNALKSEKTPDQKAK